MKELSMKFTGKIIKELRESAGESQEQLANALNAPNRETIARWENGSRDLKREHIIAIAQHFNVSSDYLLGLSRAAAPDNFVQEVVNRYGLTESALNTLEHLNAPLDFDEKEKNRVIKKQKHVSDSVESGEIFESTENGKISLIKSLTEEEKLKLFSILQMETNKQILSILNDILTVSTGREWETYGMQILNTIYNYCRGKYENVEIKRNDLAGTTYYEISADTQRNMELYTLNNILTEMRNTLTTEKDLPFL